jgi:DNA-binding FadR family transcriptional regulator
MMNPYKSSDYLSEFLRYIAQKSLQGEERIPPLTELSKELKVSVASLREQLEVAKVMGFVEVRPKTGIRWLPYQFSPSILLSVAYSVTICTDFFDQFRDFRNHLEAAYFYESVTKLLPDDLDKLLSIVETAESKIQKYPPLLPHHEHYLLHQLLFSKIDNLFVQGVFDVYWDIYEARGFSIISDLDYLVRVWDYHRRFVVAIRMGNYSEAYLIFMEHKELFLRSPKLSVPQNFE